jgi:sRNA-binding carbon storage regulator CsrA
LLTVTRRPGEALAINGPCRVVIMSVRGIHITLGIEGADGKRVTVTREATKQVRPKKW